jgi:hypothetical protein
VEAVARQSAHLIASAAGTLGRDYGAWAGDGDGAKGAASAAALAGRLQLLRVTHGAVLTLSRAALALARHPNELYPLLADVWPHLLLLLPPEDAAPSADGRWLLPQPGPRGSALSDPALVSALYPRPPAPPHGDGWRQNDGPGEGRMEGVPAPSHVTPGGSLARRNVPRAASAPSSSPSSAAAAAQELLEASRRYMARRLALLRSAAAAQAGGNTTAASAAPASVRRLGLLGWEEEQGGEGGRDSGASAGQGVSATATAGVGITELPANSASLLARYGGGGRGGTFPISTPALALHAAAISLVALLAVAPRPAPAAAPLQPVGPEGGERGASAAPPSSPPSDLLLASSGVCAGDFLRSRFDGQVWPRLRALLLSAALAAAADAEAAVGSAREAGVDLDVAEPAPGPSSSTHEEGGAPPGLAVTPVDRPSPPPPSTTSTAGLAPPQRLLLVALQCVAALARPCVTLQREPDEEEQEREEKQAREAAAAVAVAQGPAVDPAAEVATFLRPDAVARGRTPRPTLYDVAPSLLRRHAGEAACLLCAALVQAGRADAARRRLRMRGQRAQYSAAEAAAAFPPPLQAAASVALSALHAHTDTHAVGAAARWYGVVLS